jgi:hypothetical protein
MTQKMQTVKLTAQSEVKAGSHIFMISVPRIALAQAAAARVAASLTLWDSFVSRLATVGGVPAGFRVVMPQTNFYDPLTGLDKPLLSGGKFSVRKSFDPKTSVFTFRGALVKA